MKKILILFGGNSYEHYISCLSAKSIISNINKDIYAVDMIGITLEGEWLYFDDDLEYLDKNWVECSSNIEVDNIVDTLKLYDVVIPIMHGDMGEDGKIQGLLEMTDVKYVGCGISSSVIGYDKEWSKIMFNDANILQVPYIVMNKKIKYNEVVEILGNDLIIKPCRGGSSIGINRSLNKRQYNCAVKEALRFDNKIMVEKYIHGRELECGVLYDGGKKVSVVGEIISKNSFYDYEAKYESDSEVVIPANISKKVVKRIQEWSLKAFDKIEGRGIMRIDFFYDEDNDILYLNEVNTMPGFTTISMFPKLFMCKGYSYSDLISVLIENA